MRRMAYRTAYPGASDAHCGLLRLGSMQDQELTYITWQNLCGSTSSLQLLVNTQAHWCLEPTGAPSEPFGPAVCAQLPRPNTRNQAAGIPLYKGPSSWS